MFLKTLLISTICVVALDGFSIQTTITIDHANATVESKTSLTGFNHDQIEKQFMKALTENHLIEDFHLTKIKKLERSVDVNGIDTGEYLRYIFLSFSSSLDIPDVLVSLKKREVRCPAALPKDVYCIPEVSFELRGPLASYEGSHTFVTAKEMFNGKQYLRWTFSRPDLKTLNLKGEFVIESINFTPALRHYIEKNYGSKALGTSDLSQNLVLNFMGQLIRSANEGALQ